MEPNRDASLKDLEQQGWIAKTSGYAAWLGELTRGGCRTAARCNPCRPWNTRARCRQRPAERFAMADMPWISGSTRRTSRERLISPRCQPSELMISR